MGRGLRRRGRGRFHLASPRGPSEVRLILSRGAPGAPQPLVFGASHASWSLLPRARRDSAVSEAGLRACGLVDGEANHREAEPQWRRAKSGPRRTPATLLACGGWMLGAEASSAGTIAPASGWSIRASAPPFGSSRGAQVQPHLCLPRILRLANPLWFLLRSRWILKKAAVEVQGGRTS